MRKIDLEVLELPGGDFLLVFKKKFVRKMDLEVLELPGGDFLIVFMKKV